MLVNAGPAAVTMSDEVTAFLMQGGLEAYGRILREEGVDTMDRLALMDDRDMMNLGIKLGHRRQLQQMLVWRFACGLAAPCPVLVWGPHGMAPFCCGPWSHQWPPGFGEPPFADGVQQPVTSQPIKVLSPSLEAFVDVATLLQICAIRLLQDVDIEIPKEMVIFSGHGVIGQACSDEVRAAVKVRADFAKQTAELDFFKHKQQLTKLRDEATVQARGHMNRVVERLRSIEQSGASLPSAEESERAVAVLVDRFYTEERRRLGDEADKQHFEASYGNFWKYLENPADLTGLGEAMLQMALVSRLGKTAHVLRSVAMIAVVRRAGGHSDRSRFEQEILSLVPLWLQKRTSSAELSYLRSVVHLCFTKLLGDVPGAFQSKAHQRSRALRKKRERTKPANKGEPEPEHEEKASYGT